MKLHSCEKHKIANMVLINELEHQGWHIDKWGYAQKTVYIGIKDVPVRYRWKFQHHSIRLERRIKLFDTIREDGTIAKHKPEWLRIRTLKY